MKNIFILLMLLFTIPSHAQNDKILRNVIIRDDRGLQTRFIDTRLDDLTINETQTFDFRIRCLIEDNIAHLNVLMRDDDNPDKIESLIGKSKFELRKSIDSIDKVIKSLINNR